MQNMRPASVCSGVISVAGGLCRREDTQCAVVRSWSYNMWKRCDDLTWDFQNKKKNSTSTVDMPYERGK